MRISIFRLGVMGGFISAIAVGAVTLQDQIGRYFARATTRPAAAAIPLTRQPLLAEGEHEYQGHKTRQGDQLAQEPAPQLALTALQQQIDALQAELAAARMATSVQQAPARHGHGTKGQDRRQKEALESSLIVYSADVKGLSHAGLRSGDQFSARLTTNAAPGQTVTAVVLEGPLQASRLVGGVSGRAIRFDRIQTADGRERSISASVSMAGFSNRQLARASGLTVTQALASAVVGTFGSRGGDFGDQLAAGVVRSGSRSAQRLVEDELDRLDLPKGSIINVVID